MGICFGNIRKCPSCKMPAINIDFHDPTMDGIHRCSSKFCWHKCCSNCGYCGLDGRWICKCCLYSNTLHSWYDLSRSCK